MDYLISTDKNELKACQTELDGVLGYPESLESLHHVGIGIHAPKELGRALHHAEITQDKIGLQFALPIPKEMATPKAAKTARRETKLPDDWYPEL